MFEKKIQAVIDALEYCEPTDDEICDALENNPALSDLGLSIASGETRYAVMSPKWDFVLKIPRYEYASRDYCEIERQHYESAKTFGVERICLPIEFFYETDSGICIYKQPCYTVSTSDAGWKYGKYLDKRHTPNPHSKIVQKVKRDCYGGYRIDERWIGRVIQLYGKKFMRSVELWIQANQINDLHNSNTGWLNNKPIIIDYAGYHD